jgi:hypothetical protein
VGESKPDSDGHDKKPTKAEEKTIEYSILQQLLYKEKKASCRIPVWSAFLM